MNIPFIIARMSHAHCSSFSTLWNVISVFFPLSSSHYFNYSSYIRYEDVPYYFGAVTCLVYCTLTHECELSISRVSISFSCFWCFDTIFPRCAVLTAVDLRKGFQSHKMSQAHNQWDAEKERERERLKICVSSALEMLKLWREDEIYEIHTRIAHRMIHFKMKQTKNWTPQ